MLKQLKKRGCAGSQCVSGCPRAACEQFPGHSSHRGLYGTAVAGGWHGARPVLNAGARWWQAGSHRFRLDYPISWKQKHERCSRPGTAAEGLAERAALQTGLHPRASAGGSSSAENSFQGGCFSVFHSCSFCRDRPWRKLDSEQPSQGPPAALPESLDCSACPPVLRPTPVSSPLGVLVGVEVGAQGARCRLHGDFPA